MVKLKEDGQSLFVYAPYEKDFISKARQIHGKWDSKERAWVFEKENEILVKKLLIKIYGEDGSGTEKTIPVLVDLDKCPKIIEKEKQLKLGKFLIATRFERDSYVSLPNEVVVVEGGFTTSGGSRKYPKVSWEPGTKIKVNLPKLVYKEIYNATGISLYDKKSRKIDLEIQKKKLLKRLEAINEELLQLNDGF